MITVRPERVEDQAEIKNVRDAAMATLRQTYRPNQKAIENKARIGATLKRLVAIDDGRVCFPVRSRRACQVVRN